jgi:hypothetical protein
LILAGGYGRLAEREMKASSVACAASNGLARGARGKGGGVGGISAHSSRRRVGGGGLGAFAGA